MPVDPSILFQRNAAFENIKTPLDFYQQAQTAVGQNIINQGNQTRNKFLEPSLQAAVEGQQLSNQQTAIQNQYLPQKSEADIQSTLLANTAQGIRNQYLPDSLKADLTGKTLSNENQQLQNQYLPKEKESALLTQSLAQDNAKMANKYQESQLQGGIKGTELDNQGKSLTNEGTSLTNQKVKNELAVQPEILQEQVKQEKQKTQDAATELSKKRLAMTLNFVASTANMPDDNSVDQSWQTYKGFIKQLNPGIELPDHIDKKTALAMQSELNAQREQALFGAIGQLKPDEQRALIGQVTGTPSNASSTVGTSEGTSGEVNLPSKYVAPLPAGLDYDKRQEYIAEQAKEWNKTVKAANSSPGLYKQNNAILNSLDQEIATNNWQASNGFLGKLKPLAGNIAQVPNDIKDLSEQFVANNVQQLTTQGITVRGAFGELLQKTVPSMWNDKTQNAEQATRYRALNTVANEISPTVINDLNKRGNTDPSLPNQIVNEVIEATGAFDPKSNKVDNNKLSQLWKPAYEAIVNGQDPQTKTTFTKQQADLENISQIQQNYPQFSKFEDAQKVYSQNEQIKQNTANQNVSQQVQVPVQHLSKWNEALQGLKPYGAIMKGLGGAASVAGMVSDAVIRPAEASSIPNGQTPSLSPELTPISNKQLIMLKEKHPEVNLSNLRDRQTNSLASGLLLKGYVDQLKNAGIDDANLLDVVGLHLFNTPDLAEKFRDDPSAPIKNYIGTGVARANKQLVYNGAGQLRSIGEVYNLLQQRLLLKGQDLEPINVVGSSRG